MDLEITPCHMAIMALLLVTSIQSGTALSSRSLPPTADNSPPPEPPSTDNDTSTTDGNLFINYKAASLDQVGKYDIVWTDLNNADKHNFCYLTGYYDSTVLTNPLSVKLCFDSLRSVIVTNYALGYIYFSETFYYVGTTSCVVNCLEQNPSSGNLSVQISLLSLAFSLLASLALSLLK